MQSGHEKELAAIESKVTALKGHFATMSSTDDTDELLILIRKPGFTTPAELMLIHSVLDSIQSQAQTVSALRRSLLEGCRAIAPSAPLEATGTEAHP